MDLQQSLTYGVPLLIMIVANWLQHDTLPRWANAMIVVVVTVAIAWGWAALNHELGAGLVANILLIISLSFAIMALPQLDGLQQWLRDTLASPFAVLVKAPSAPLNAVRWQGMTSSAFAPPVQSRASALQPGQTWASKVSEASQNGTNTTPLPAVAPTQDPAEPTPPPSASQ